MAPAEAYEKLDEGRRLPYWRETLGAAELNRGAIVCERDAELVGVVSFGPSDHPAMKGAVEIKHLYVRNSARGTGLGRRLLEAAFDHFRAIELHDVALAVVRENDAARRFYRAMGGTERGEFTDPGPLWRSSNVIVGWQLKT